MAKDIATSSSTTVNPGLGTVGSLFSEAWELFKKTWTKQLAFMVVVSLLSFAILIVAGVAFAMFNAPQLPAVMSAIQNNGVGLEAVLPVILGSAGIILFFLIIAFWLLGAAYAAGLLLVVQAGATEKEISISEALTMGVRKAWPLLVAGCVMAVLVTGGYWLFVIPGIIMALFFAYTSFEVVLSDQSPMNALRQSVRIVGANFWGIFGRLLLLGVVLEAIIIVWSMVNEVLTKNDAGLLLVVSSLAYLVAQYAIQFYAMAYAISLYNRSRAAAVNAKPGSLKKMAIISLIGWVVGILFSAVLFSALKTAAPMIEESIRKAQEQRDQTDRYMQQTEMYTDDTTTLPEGVKVDKNGNYVIEQPLEDSTLYR